MKTDIYTLLGMIKNNNAPNKIMFGADIYNYVEEEQDYKNEDENDWIFEDYIISHILNDEVEILETTITYNGDQKCTEVTNKIAQLPMINEDELYDIRLTFNQNRRKINEIIDRINNE